MSTAEQIYELVQQLPSFRQIEILDFASYVAEREEKAQSDSKPSFHQFAGILKDSKTFAGDPVGIQRALRDEWR